MSTEREEQESLEVALHEAMGLSRCRDPRRRFVATAKLWLTEGRLIESMMSDHKGAADLAHLLGDMEVIVGQMESTLNQEKIGDSPRN